MTEVELGRKDLGRNQYVVSLELDIFQGRPKSFRPNSETVKIRPMAQEADSTHFFRPISVHPPGTTATEPGAREIEKHREIRQWIQFLPVVMEVQGFLSESSEIFITALRPKISKRSFLKQRFSMGLQIGHPACVLGTVSDREMRSKKFITDSLLFQTCSSLQLLEKFVSTG